jgi:hypothetical protein
LDIYIQDVKSELNINNMQYFWTETGYLGDTSDTPSSDIMYAKKRFMRKIQQYFNAIIIIV